MEETKKRTDRKTQGVRARFKNEQQAQKNPSTEEQASRVVDLSWAADYLDDDWENKYSQDGGYNTRAKAHAEAQKAKAEAVDLLSQTQEFKAVKPPTIEELVKTAKEQAPKQDDDLSDDLVKIRDAVTDKTIISLTEAQNVRKAVASLAAEVDELDDQIKIRDAVTDKTIVSVTEAQNVRKAVSELDMDDVAIDFEELGSIRDASSFGRLPSAFEESKHEKVVSEVTAQEELRQPAVAAAADKKASVSEEAESKASVKEQPKRKGIVFTDKDLNPEAFIKEKAPAKKTSINLEALFDEDELDEDTPVRRTAPAKRQQRTRLQRPKPVRPAYREYEDDYYYEDYYDEDDYDYYDDPYEQKSPLRFIPLVLVIALCVVGFIAARIVCNDTAINPSDYSRISYTVEQGLTDSQLADDLYALGLIDNELVFKLRCLFYDAKYVPDTYELSPCYSSEKIINILSGYKYGTDD